MKTKSHLIAILSLVFLLSWKNIIAEEVFNKDAFISSAKKNAVINLSINNCIAFALKNNSEIKVRRIEPKIRKEEVTIAKSIYEPVFTLDYLMRDNTTTSTSPFISGDLTNKEKDAFLGADISGKTPLGTLYSLDFDGSRGESNSKYQSINPAYATEPSVSVSQPLLDGAGPSVNNAGIVIAINNKRASEESFEDLVTDIISNVKISYYNYIYAKKAYRISKLSIKRTLDLLKTDKARYKKGIISSVDLLEAESAVLQKLKALISAETEVKSAEDNLKLITNIVDDPSMWNARIELVDKPDFTAKSLDLVGCLKNAFLYRPDYKARRIELDNKDVYIYVTKNALLPTVDLIGSFGLNGLGDSLGDSFQSIGMDYKDWTAGIKFNVPWGNSDRARYAKANMEKEQALIALSRMEQNIILDVRDKVRAVDLQSRQVNAARSSMQKENENYKAQKERYAEGQVSTHDMLDYQDKLAQSELDYTRALIDYNIALINLDKSEGVTLAANNIKLED